MELQQICFDDDNDDDGGDNNVMLFVLDRTKNSRRSPASLQFDRCVIYTINRKDDSLADVGTRRSSLEVAPTTLARYFSTMPACPVI